MSHLMQVEKWKVKIKHCISDHLNRTWMCLCNVHWKNKHVCFLHMLVDHFSNEQPFACGCIEWRLSHLYLYICIDLLCFVLFRLSVHSMLARSLGYYINKFCIALICFIADILIVCHVHCTTLSARFYGRHTQMRCTVVVKHFSWW